MLRNPLWNAGNPLYLCKTPKQIMGNMGITVDLNAEISNTYDEFIMEVNGVKKE
jgi:hypothetical protein